MRFHLQQDIFSHPEETLLRIKMDIVTESSLFDIFVFLHIDVKFKKKKGEN